MPIQTATKDKLSIAELSALYDRIYDSADRLFKRYNPCNIQVKNNKTKCINSHYNCNHLCCQEWTDRCKHWQSGCTVKCIACKLFICDKVREDKIGTPFIKTLSKLRRVVNECGLSNFDYYITKKEALKRRYIW